MVLKKIVGIPLGMLMGFSAFVHGQHSEHDHGSRSPQSSSTAQPSMQEMDHATSAMADQPSAHDHHSMGPHMRMSTLRDPHPGDPERAAKIVSTARQSVAKYHDFRVAEEDGYKIFLPQVKQKMYHFTNWKYALEAEFWFNPEHPTSLLYEKRSENDFKLVGAMYTAPVRYSEDDLDRRIPLSVAQWHQHVNMCQPPAAQRANQWSKTPKFGLAGSISTKEECEAAGGAFKPHVFGWMVHLYPDEKTMDAIWSVDRRLDKNSMSNMMK